MSLPARPASRRARALRGVCTLAIALCGTAQAADHGPVLRVCADPNNLPFSNNRLEGFDNKIAQIIADELRASVAYTWHSQRRGFIRQTLDAGRCDLVMGVPRGYEPVLGTKPYYHSTYVFVSATSRQLALRSFDDPVLRELKIGVHAFGDDGANSPPVHALARRGIVRNVIGFTILDTAESPPGKIIDAVATGDIDVAIVWGPFAGHFAKRQPVELAVVPVASASDRSALPFIYAMGLGVRRGDIALKERLEGVLDRRSDDIQKVLQAYGVPLVREASPDLQRMATTSTGD
jgi:mxaJ protein